MCLVLLGSHSFASPMLCIESEKSKIKQLMSADFNSLLLMVCRITVSLLSNIWPYTGLHWTIMTVNISNTNEAWGRNQAKNILQ